MVTNSDGVPVLLQIWDTHYVRRQVQVSKCPNFDFFTANSLQYVAAQNFKLTFYIQAERYRDSVRAYFRHARIMLLCFSINDRSTFVHLMEKTLATCYDNMTDDLKKGIFYLVGLKADLEAERAVSMDEAEVVASELKMKYIEVSSKQYPQGNVNELLQIITEDALATMTWKELPEDEKRKAVELSTKDRRPRSEPQPFSRSVVAYLSLIVASITRAIVFWK